MKGDNYQNNGFGDETVVTVIDLSGQGVWDYEKKGLRFIVTFVLV